MPSWGGARPCRWAAETYLWPPSALNLYQQKGWGADDLLGARNYCWPPLGMLAPTSVEELLFGLPFTWWLFWLLVFKRALLKQIPQKQFFPLLPYPCHSISHWDVLFFFFWFFQPRDIRKIIVFSIGKQLVLVSSTDAWNSKPFTLSCETKEKALSYIRKADCRAGKPDRVLRGQCSARSVLALF